MTSKGASRQKSCNACVRSKRRCDKRHPACSRCSRKNSPCIYGGQADFQAPFTPIDLEALPGSASSAAHDPFSLMAMNFGSPIQQAASLGFDAVFDPLLNTIPGGGLPAAADVWQTNLLRQHENQVMEGTGTDDLESDSSERTLTRKDYTKMNHICDDYHPWQLADPNSKISFSYAVFKGWPQEFAQRGCTCFIHRYLYKDHMPRWVLQAYTVCVLYTNSNRLNRGIVLRVLHESITDLRESGKASNLTPQQKVARVHALMLYQSIMMFDGDITLGAQAEEDCVLLESWLLEICKIKDNLKGEATTNKDVLRQRPPESWERWIFAESVRKTSIIGFALLTMWELLKERQNPNELGAWTVIHRFTLSRHLWDAPDSFNFFKAWKEKPFFIISAFNFEEFLRTGVGDDLDDFSKLFLTIYFGVSEIKTFCYETSGHQLV